MKTTGRNLSIEKLSKVAGVLKVIAHPVRLEILEILETAESMDVGTLCSKISCGCEISMLSHHLTKMKDNGVLDNKREGKQIYYSIKDRQILSLFDCMEKCKL
ncbi:MAG: transcriptional regulator [Flavobacteriaceae bacterium]|nr:MAG: transcriptional regulator [Flavobacteriaceae bacterium]